jgi:hypothetical protein
VLKQITSLKLIRERGDHDQLTLSGLVTGIWELVSSPALSFFFIIANKGCVTL